MKLRWERPEDCLSPQQWFPLPEISAAKPHTSFDNNSYRVLDSRPWEIFVSKEAAEAHLEKLIEHYNDSTGWGELLSEIGRNKALDRALKEWVDLKELASS
ncbi:hypothetical protein MYX82_02175 [Acidobacteria bacterium AH-259-D05]|nr:hypothetical protein [Acidobacteria bacterium AH-259-D05]